MIERIDYLAKDSLCESILQELKNSGFVSNWLKENQETYNSVTMNPKGLPAIGKIFYNGERFGNIAQFVSLYKEMGTLQERLNEK